MTDYFYDMDLVVDPLNPANVVANGQVSIFDPADTTGTTLLALKDPSGLPLPNPLPSNANGFLPPRIASVPQTMWKSGGFTGYFNSYKGLRDESVAAVTAAQTAANSATAAANEVVTTAAVDVAGNLKLTKANGTVVDAGPVKGAKGDKGDKGDKGTDGANVLPTDDAIKQAINDTASGTRGALNATYLDKASSAKLLVAPDRLPTGGTLITYGDGSASATHFATTVSSAFALTGWPGASSAARRGASGQSSIISTNNMLAAATFAPYEASAVIVRSALYDQGVAGNDSARKAFFANNLRVQMALLHADSRIEETSSAFAFSAGFTAVTGDATWSGNGNKFGSGTSYVDVTVPNQDTYILLGGSSSTTGAQITVTDQTAGGAALGTINTASTQPTGSSGPIPYRIPTSARGHVVRFARASGATSLTVDAMLPQAVTPPSIVLIKNHYANDYSTLTGATLGSDAAVDAFNAVIDSVLADFPNVLTINPTDPATGWVKATHAAATGFEYTTAGHAKMAALIQAAATPAAGTKGITQAMADARYLSKSASVGEGPLRWTDPRIGGFMEDPTLATLSDQTAQWNAAMTLLAPRGGKLSFPGVGGAIGIAGTTSPVPGGATVEGSGFDYSEANTASPRYGTVIRATAAMQRLVQLGNTGAGSSTAPGVTGGSIRHLSLDGRNLAEEVVTTQARRNYIDTCQVAWGNTRGIGIHGQNTYVVGKGVVIQNDRGDCITIDAYYDHKIFDWELREMGTTGAGVRVVAGTQGIADITISRIHSWAGANGVGKVAQGLVVLEANGYPIQNVNITDNILEGIKGPELYMGVNATGLITNVKFNGTNAFNYDSDSTHPAVLVVGAGGSIVDLVSVGNSFAGNGPTAQQYSAFVEYQGTFASTGGWDIGPNTGRYMAAHILGTPATMPNFSGAFPILNGSGRVYARKEGSAALNGGGTTFTIPHFLSKAPRTVSVTPGSAAAAPPFYVTSDATNITVTYTSATPSGTGNVTLNWSAAI